MNHAGIIVPDLGVFEEVLALVDRGRETGEDNICLAGENQLQQQRIFPRCRRQLIKVDVLQAVGHLGQVVQGAGQVLPRLLRPLQRVKLFSPPSLQVVLDGLGIKGVYKQLVIEDFAFPRAVAPHHVVVGVDGLGACLVVKVNVSVDIHFAF